MEKTIHEVIKLFDEKFQDDQLCAWLAAGFSYYILFWKKCDCDYLDIKVNARFYFFVLGMAHYFLSRTGADENTVIDTVEGNFVYLELFDHIEKNIVGRTPWFTIYRKTKDELEFCVRSLLAYKNYGIEVKSEDGAGRTAQELLKDGEKDRILYREIIQLRILV